MRNWQILHGDCRKILPTLPSESVHCCVTSPPYWGLRDYGVEGQIGLEKTPELYVAEMVAIFREVKRVLRKDGTLWLNLGDSYAAVNRGENARPRAETLTGIQAGNPHSDIRTSRELIYAQKAAGIKPKDLVGIPWLVAFALRADGWFLRQDIIWSKPNPMPESVTDRCTKAHEYIFLLSKSGSYFYDQDLIAEPLRDASIARLIQDVEAQQGSDRVPGKTNGNMKAVRFGGSKYGDDDSEQSRTKSGKEWNPKQAGGGAINNNRSGYFDKDTGEPLCGVTANKKSVWEVTTQPFKEAHFATFPPELIKPCILAGCPAGGTVLDPFMGAGTTALVAQQNHCKSLGIELNQEYIEIAAKRLSQDVLDFALPNNETRQPSDKPQP